MAGLGLYLKNAIAESVRANPTVQATAARVLWLRAGLERRNPTRRLALLGRAAHVSPPASGLHRRLCAAIRTELNAFDAASIDWNQVGGTAPRTDLPKAIILKAPVSAEEKGILHVAFEEQWLRLLRSGQATAIARHYDLLLGPSWSPPPDLALLLAAAAWPGRVFTLLSNYEDAEIMAALADRIVPVPLLASSWVNPALYEDCLPRAKVYDIVMLANFARFKRHWLFFHVLRSLPRYFRVLLLGVPLGDRDERALRDEARAFGVEDRFDLVVRPTRAQIVEGLCRAKTSLIFSRVEGSCIGVAESLFADTPVGLFRDARIGSKAFINEWTGRLLERRGLAGQIVRLVEESERYRARSWAMEHISCYRSTEVLNDALRVQARREGRPWTRDAVPMQNDLVPTYLDAETANRMAEWNADFGAGTACASAPLPRSARRRGQRWGRRLDLFCGNGENRGPSARTPTRGYTRAWTHRTTYSPTCPVCRAASGATTRPTSAPARRRPGSCGCSASAGRTTSCGVIAALRLFARRRHYAGVVTDGGASGMLFAWLQALCPWGRKPHVLIDCNWQVPPGRLAAWLRRLRVRLAARSVYRFVVWASHEIKDYACAFHIAPERLEYVPFHTTAHNYRYAEPRRRLRLRGRQLRPRLSHACRRGSAARRARVDRHHARGTPPGGRRGAGPRPRRGNRRRRLSAGAGVGANRRCADGQRPPPFGWSTDVPERNADGQADHRRGPQMGRRPDRRRRERADCRLRGRRRPYAALCRGCSKTRTRRRRLGEHGRTHAARFTTERTMRTVYDLVKGAAVPTPLPAEESRHVAPGRAA